MIHRYITALVNDQPCSGRPPTNYRAISKSNTDTWMQIDIHSSAGVHMENLLHMLCLISLQTMLSVPSKMKTLGCGCGF